MVEIGSKCSSNSFIYFAKPLMMVNAILWMVLSWISVLHFIKVDHNTCYSQNFILWTSEVFSFNRFKIFLKIQWLDLFSVKGILLERGGKLENFD